MLLGAPREESGWRKVEVEGAVGERFPLYISPDKNPSIVKTEAAGTKILVELKARQPQVGWRLVREEGIVSAGYQKVVRIVVDSSMQVRFEYNMQALAD